MRFNACFLSKNKLGEKSANAFRGAGGGGGGPQPCYKSGVPQVKIYKLSSIL